MKLEIQKERDLLSDLSADGRMLYSHPSLFAGVMFKGPNEKQKSTNNLRVPRKTNNILVFWRLADRESQYIYLSN